MSNLKELAKHMTIQSILKDRLTQASRSKNKEKSKRYKKIVKTIN